MNRIAIVGKPIIKKASEEDLLAVVDKKTASAIVEYFKENN